MYFKKRYIILFVSILIFLSSWLWFKQPSLANRICIQYAGSCDEDIFVDAQNQMAFIKNAQDFLFVYLDENGKISDPSIGLPTTNLYDQELYWAGTSNQKSHFLVGIATNKVKHIELVSPFKSQVNKIHYGDYVLFYIPLKDPQHLYKVQFRGYNEHGDLIYE